MIPPGLAVLIAPLLVGAASVPQDDGGRAPGGLAPPLDEGELRNDAFLPVSEAAARALAAGDAALAEAREGPPRDAPLRLGAAFEAWREALAGSRTGDAVPVPPDVPAVEARVVEGVEHAVLRRIAGLSQDERERWRARFDGLAEAELAGSASDEGRLAALERGIPATPAAARAALRLADLALEGGRSLRARSFAERAALHLELAGEGSGPLAGAAAARLAHLAELEETRREPPGAWAAADDLVPAGSVRWEDPQGTGPSLAPPEPGVGVRPGAVPLAGGRLAVQVPDGVVLVTLPSEGEPPADGRGLAVERLVRLSEVLGELPRLEQPAAPRRAPGPPGWPLLPAAADGDLVLVHGRAARRDALRPNALLALRPPEAGATPFSGGRDAAAGLPRLRWGLLGAERLGPGGRPLGEDALLAALAPGDAGAGALEWQPGPLVLDGTVVAQLRAVGPGGATAHLAAVDLGTGEVLWTRALAKGSDLRPLPAIHLEAGPVAALAGQPLARAGTRVLAGTHLGAGALVEVADGRLLWTLRNRRRDPLEAGWSGDRPRVGPPAEPGGPPLLLWAPADSDRLYLVRAGPLPSGDWRGLLAAPPLPLGESEVLVGGSADEVLVLGRAGPERTVSALGPRSGARTDALRLGREERFRGAGLLSERRVLVPTSRGIHLFDRERELALLDHEPPPPSLPAGGALVAAGDRVVLLSAEGVAVYAAATPAAASPDAPGESSGGR